MPYAMHSFESNSSNVPAFLVKLWKLVEDPNCDDLIAWSDSGYSFIIKDQARFAKELLPQYFKHNNMASFIRQLNMYGFKKVMNYEKTGLRNENNEMEFQHGFFVKERSELLELIKRKISNPKVPDPPSKTNAKDILIDLTSIREKQENMDSMLLKMKQENELLWRELTAMRQKHKAQEQIIQKVIQFLVSIVQRSGNQNMGVGVQRKITRMIHDSSKTTSSQVSRTIDVLRNKNSDCIIVPEQIVSPLGPVIHEVTDNDHDEANHSPMSVVKSPSVIHVAESPAINESDGNSRPSLPLVSKSSKSNSTAKNLNVPVEHLGILEALQQRSPATNKEETNPSESILGIPLEYMTDQENAEVANVISIPEDGTVCNVISIPEDDNIGNVISIPECSTISDIIPISKLSNVISIPDKEAISNNPTTPLSNANDSIFTGSEFFNSPDIAAFSEMQPSTSNESSSQSLRSSLSKSDFVDSLLSESLQTPKIITPDDDMCNSARETKTELIKKDEMSKSPSTKNATHDEHNYQLTTTESTSNLVKNALTNHLLSVDEKLNYAQDQLASGPWNLDVQNLLGVCGSPNSWTSLDPQLFSTDDFATYEAFTSSLPDDICIKTESNDIMGNEIVQFTPNMLEMDIENSPLFEALNQDAEVPSSDFNYQTEPLLDVLKDTVVSEDPNFSTNQSLTDDTSQKRKKSSPKTLKNKRRKAK